MSVVKLVNYNNDAKSWGPSDVCDSFKKKIEDGFDGEVIIVMSSKKDGTHTNTFIQCGLSLSEMVGVLEVAKLNIFESM
jgi:hypothetical protein